MYEYHIDSPNCATDIYKQKKPEKLKKNGGRGPRKHSQSVGERDKIIASFLFYLQRIGRHILPQEKPDTLPKTCQPWLATPTNADTHDLGHHRHTLGGESSDDIEVRISRGWTQLWYTQPCSWPCDPSKMLPACSSGTRPFKTRCCPSIRPRTNDAPRCSSTHLKFIKKSSRL